MPLTERGLLCVASARDAIDEIRTRLSILDVVSDYVTLKRVGKNHVGLCPFHAEKTPSFTVSEQFQTWHCFGCGEHGDIFAFVMKAESLTFPEALERLAKRAGVELERLQKRHSSRRDALREINEIAASYYRELLKRTPIAIEYLRRRGLADQTIEQFKLGYAAAAWDGLVSYLTKKGVNLAYAAEAGLLIKSDRDGGYYDRFRHRIIFPIFDIHEQTIGFGGRAIASDDQPKYLNSPETPLFNKTRALYGLNFARKKIAELDQAIVVEGYTDVIACHQAGFENCVATLGTALTREHINVLLRYTKRVVLAYDADSAGISAAIRGASMFEEAGCDVRIARLPGGDDPDSVLRKGLVTEFAAAISDALPIIDYRLAILMESHDLSSYTGRAEMLKQAVRILAEIPTSIEREKHIRKLARYHPNFETGTTRAEEHLRQDIELIARRRQSIKGIKTPINQWSKPKTAVEKAEISILRTLIRNEEGAQLIVEALSENDFSNDLTRTAAKAAFEAVRENGVVELNKIIGSVTAEVGRFLSELALREDMPPLNEKGLQDCIELIKKSKLRKMRTSDILAPYMKDGIIDASKDLREAAIRQAIELFRETGKVDPKAGPKGMNESDS